MGKKGKRSGLKGSQKKPGKNWIKQRFEALESAVTDGIDRLIMDIRSLFHNEQVLANGLENQDITVAAIRALLVEKEVLTDEEIDGKRVEIIEIKRKVLAQKQKEEEEAKKSEEEADADSKVDPDLVRMKEAAERAGEDSGLPEGAFVFGG